MEHLSPEYMPQGWYDRFDGEQILTAAGEQAWEEWPESFEERITSDRRWRRYSTSMMSEMAVTRTIDTGLALHLFNKSAIMYTVGGGFPYSKLPIQEYSARFPLEPFMFLEELYEAWLQGGTWDETHDARFVLAPLHLSGADNMRVSEWCGMHGQPLHQDPWCLYQQEEDIDYMINRHILLCDLVKAKAARAELYSPEEVIVHESCQTFWPKLRHSSLAPTCRAIFALARLDSTEARTMLLVLTGHTRTWNANH